MVLKRKIVIYFCLLALLVLPTVSFATEKGYNDSGYKFLTPYKYDSIQQSVGDLVVAMVNGKTAAESISGKTILPFVFADIEIVCDEKGRALGLLGARQKSGRLQYELYNLAGKPLTDTNYDHAQVFDKYVILGKGIENDRQDGVYDFSKEEMIVPLSPRRIDSASYEDVNRPTYPFMDFTILYKKNLGYNPQLDDKFDFTAVNKQGQTLIPTGRYAYLNSFAPYDVIDCYDENMKVLAQYTKDGQKLAFVELPTDIHVGLFALTPDIFVKGIINRLGQFNETNRYAAWKNGKFSLIELTFDFPNDANSDYAKPSLWTKYSQWAENELKAAGTLGLIPFELDIAYQSPCTREEFCLYLSQMLEKYSGKSLNELVQGHGELKTFPDCPRYEVSVAYTLGIVSGINVTTFRPEAKLTREQAAAMLGRTARFLEIESNSSSLTFKDSDSFSDYAKEDIAFVSSIKSDSANGIRVMTGIGNDKFNPRGTYSREQAIMTLLRLYSAETL